MPSCSAPLRSLSLSLSRSARACCLLWGNWKEIIITCTICSWVVRVSWHSCHAPTPPPRRLWRNAKVLSALGQEVTRAAPASASCSSSCSSFWILLLADVVCFVVVAAWPKVQKCMKTTCGNVEIYSYQVTIATVERVWRWDTLPLINTTTYLILG